MNHFVTCCRRAGKPAVLCAILTWAGLPLLAQVAATPMIDDPDLGFSFTVPSGWETQRHPIGYIAVRTGSAGAIFVIGLPETDPGKLRQGLEEGFLAGEEIQLRPSGRLEPLEGAPGAIAADLAGSFQGMMVKARAVVVPGTPRSSALVMVAAASDLYNGTHSRMAESVARSVRFAPVRLGGDSVKQAALGAASRDPRLAMWEQRLRGRKLHYFSRYNSGGGVSSGGYSEHKTLGLCADGTFLFNGEFSGAIDVPGASASMNGPSRDAGRWSLAARNGSVYLMLGNESVALTTDGEKTFLNRVRWLVDDQAGCR